MSILRENAFSETIPKLIIETGPKPWLRNAHMFS